MRKFFVLAFLVFVSVLAACAEHYMCAVAVKGGDVHYFEVTDDLKLSFGVENISVASSSGDTRFDICDVIKFRYIAPADVRENEINNSVTLMHRSLWINNPDIDEVMVFGIDGRELRRVRLGASREVSLEGLHGIVIVKVGRKSIKIKL